MAKISSITFTNNNLDSKNMVKQIEYKHTILLGDKVWETSYNNKNDNDGFIENFNKLYKENENVYEKIGNSQNKNSWKIKEFLNTILLKQYTDNYNNNSFDEQLLSVLFNNNIDNNNIKKKVNNNTFEDCNKINDDIFFNIINENRRRVLSENNLLNYKKNI